MVLQNKMADSKEYHSFQESLEKSHDLFSDESGNLTVEEADISIFITPSNVNEVDSSDEEDVFLSELLGDMAASSPREDRGEEGTAGGGPSGAQAVQAEWSKSGLDPFEDDIDDSLLIKCTEKFTEIVPETSSEGSDGEGDIPSLMTRVLKNLGTVPGASKPPICPLKEPSHVNMSMKGKSVGRHQIIPDSDKDNKQNDHHIDQPGKCLPKKGYNVKSSTKIKSVCRPHIRPDSDEENEENDPKFAKKTRFHTATEQEVAQLQMDAKAQRTHQQTRWGVNILIG